MAIVDVTVIPLGTESPSISEHVVEMQHILKSFQEEQKNEYQLNPMNTIIEGGLPILFDIIQTLHKSLFKKGVKRLSTNIRIDDRRDKKTEMKNNLKSVYDKM